MADIRSRPVCRQYTRNVPGERHFYVARYAVMCHPPDFSLIGRLPSNAADAECLNPLDFLSATMKAGRNGMSLDWTQRDLREGLRCFHSGAFFEAHEHWESVWLAVQEPEKAFLQGLIQVAASFHHFQRGNLAGTVSLLRSALRHQERYDLPVKLHDDVRESPSMELARVTPDNPHGPGRGRHFIRWRGLQQPE